MKQVDLYTEFEMEKSISMYCAMCAHFKTCKENKLCSCARFQSTQPKKEAHHWKHV